MTEYCAVSFTSSLTQQQTEKLERIQKTSLTIIMGDSYVDYETALESCGHQSLSDRRDKRCLDLSLKCIKHPRRNRRLFPENNHQNNRVRNSETFTVNFARTDSYRDSAIPYCQQLLNKHFDSKAKT